MNPNIPNPPNNTQLMVQKILTETLTKPQLFRRLRVLKDLINFMLFKLSPEETSLSVDKKIQLFLALHQHDILELNLLRQEGSWLTSLGDDFYQKFNRDNLTRIFESLEKELAETKHIILYLPTEIPEASQMAIGQWFKTNVGVDTTFETKFDANLIGGCAISYNGMYRDYSLRAKIETNKQSILDSLKTFSK